MKRRFFHLWFLGIVNPVKAIDMLKGQPAPAWGFGAVLIRWLGQSSTSGLLSLFLRKQPVTPLRLSLPFLTEENYYVAAVLFAPVFGLGIWLLWSGIVHLLLRLSGHVSDMDQILNIIGFGTLIPAPFVWIWDSTTIVLDQLFSTAAGAIHFMLALWGLALLALGFRRGLGVSVKWALFLPVILFAVYVPLAMLWIR